MDLTSSREIKRNDRRPEVSVIIPTFNRSGLLRQTLYSIQVQDMELWECIVIDDGSSDETEEVMNMFIKDKRFKYYQRPEEFPKGASGCRNYGFLFSSGEFIQWLDDDDVLSPEKLRLQVQTLKLKGNYKNITTCDWDFLWEGKNRSWKNICQADSLDSEEYFQALRRNQTFVPIHCFLIPRNIAIAAGGWRYDLPRNGDAEYFARVLLEADELVNTENCHVLYREHSGSRMSSIHNLENLESVILSLRLIHCYLLKKDIKVKAFFKWKLFLIFNQHWKNNKGVLRKHFYFFKENNINLNWATFYIYKYSLYQKIYPIIKRVKLNKF